MFGYLIFNLSSKAYNSSNVKDCFLISSTQFKISSIQPLDSKLLDFKKSVVFNLICTFSCSIILEFSTIKILQLSGTFEILILQPTQPARLALIDKGFLLMIISGVKNCFGNTRKLFTVFLS